MNPLVTLEKLFGVLRQRGILWCHWKSNSHLADAVSGMTDLDLLVERTRADDFRQVMAEHDFKPLNAAPGKHYPSVENYLGFDPGSGRLVHLHVHYQLILGQQHVKDYRLPIERELLGSVSETAGVPVPSPAMELIVLSLRAVLKYRLRDAVKDALPIGSSGIPPAILAEAAWLLDQTSRNEVDRVLDELSGTVPGEIVKDIIDVLTSPGSSRGRPLLLRERVRVALRPTRRISRVSATLRYAAAIGRKRTRAVGAAKRRMTPRSGGLTVAFVGSDGAGKTTVVSSVEDWLSWRLDVSTAYMGTSRPSAGTSFLKRLAKLSRAANRRISERLDADGQLSRATLDLSRRLLAARRVSEARTRYRRYANARAEASRGTIVLFDRYPLASVPIDGRSMDGPRIEREVPTPHRWMVQQLSRREQALYRRILPPDEIVALTVSAEESLRRKPDHHPEGIEAKTAAVRRSLTSATGFNVIDAEQPLADVVAEAKAMIWSWL